jgi:hypothetical protein
MGSTIRTGVAAMLLAAAACSIDRRDVGKLVTSAGGTAQCTDAGRCDSPPNPSDCGGCSAAARCYDEGATSPSNVCERCASRQWVAKAEGTACNDGLYCTDPDECTAGRCGGAPRACPTDTASGCSSISRNESSASCQADSLCSPNQYCYQESGTCQATCDGCAEAGVCYDEGSLRPSNACQRCGSARTWIAAEDGSACDDGSDCTHEACAAGSCESHAKNVDDGLYCDGTEHCVEGSGEPEHVDRPCADGLCVESDHTCAELKQLVVGGKHSCAWLRLGMKISCSAGGRVRTGNSATAWPTTSGPARTRAWPCRPRTVSHSIYKAASRSCSSRPAAFTPAHYWRR